MRRGNVCATRVVLQNLSPVCSAARLVYEHRSEGRRVARRGAARRSASPSVAKRRGAAQSSAEQCEWPPGPMALRALLYKLIEHYANEQHHVLLVPAELLFLRYMFSAPLLCANRVECVASLRDLNINYVPECERGRLYDAVPGMALTFASRHGSVRWLSSPSRGFSPIGDCVLPRRFGLQRFRRYARPGCACLMPSSGIFREPVLFASAPSTPS